MGYDYGVLNLEFLDWLRVTTNREKIVAAKPQPDQELLKTLPLSRLDDVYAGVNFPIFDDWLMKDRPSAFAAASFLADLSEPNKRQWLVVGFWDHGYSQWDGRRTRYADIDYGGNSLFDFRTMYLRFFDTWLKGKQVGLEQTPKAQNFVTGANEWRGFTDFPAQNFQEKTLYLEVHENAGKGVGLLSRKPRISRCNWITFTTRQNLQSNATLDF